MHWFIIFQAFVASLVAWALTSLGSATVLFFHSIKDKHMKIILGLAAGIMLSASFWSLLKPALEMSLDLNLHSWLIISSGLLLGTFILLIGNKFFDSIMKNNNRQSFLLIFSITLHNIPEGLAIGVAFGSVIHGISQATIMSAWLLALGIGIQNLPEGAAVSLPLLKDGYSSKRAFLWGIMSGMVEPLSAIIGALLVVKIIYLLPFLLAFAAGAMIYVVIDELIPSGHQDCQAGIISVFTMLGFIIMTILDIAFG